MDLQKTGAFIAQCRKEKNLTQKELADLLGVTDKAVSRWETGKGFPDSSLMQPLAMTLGISVTELVNGEPYRPQTAEQQADDALLSAVSYAKRMGKSVSASTLAAAGVLTALLSGSVAGISPLVMWVISGALFLLALAQSWDQWVTRRTARILGAVALAAAFGLEFIPGSAVMIMAPGPDTRVIVEKSCFLDMGLLWGYACFLPVLGAVLTAVTLVMMLMILVGRKTDLSDKVYVCTIISAVFMIAQPVLFGSDWISPVGLLIILLLAVSAMFQARANSQI